MATLAPKAPVAKTALDAGVAAALALVLLVGIIAAILGNQGCPSPDGPAATGQAKTDIPADYLRLYQEAGAKFNIDWAFLASIGAQECNHGRCATVNEVNPSGCVGPMQLGVDGACEYIVPYADQVMARAKAYGFQGGQATDPDAANALVDAQGAGCAQAAENDLASSPAACRATERSSRPGAAASTRSATTGCGSSASGRPTRAATTTTTSTQARVRTADVRAPHTQEAKKP